ncbi:PREDICTED: translation initiation factor IF-2-like [Lepidothrix coronata]|uniref:Translation initiation factor IF-2-like n=1 Tax=Lepidothrix coronata TaxID=321398 RepID=A0A6J0IA91_9PASS|nr:PREDICTED: translation initiation factor IF-2-like [Lepidothrix coronata]
MSSIRDKAPLSHTKHYGTESLNTGKRIRSRGRHGEKGSTMGAGSRRETSTSLSPTKQHKDKTPETHKVPDEPYKVWPRNRWGAGSGASSVPARDRPLPPAGLSRHRHGLGEGSSHTALLRPRRRSRPAGAAARPPPPPYTGPASPRPRRTHRAARGRRSSPAAPTGLPGAADPPSQRGAAAHRPRPRPRPVRPQEAELAPGGSGRPRMCAGPGGQRSGAAPSGSSLGAGSRRELRPWELSAGGGRRGGLQGQLCRQCAFSVVNL